MIGQGRAYLKEYYRSSLRGARGNGTEYHSALALRGLKTALRYLERPFDRFNGSISSNSMK